MRISSDSLQPSGFDRCATTSHRVCASATQPLGCAQRGTVSYCHVPLLPQGAGESGDYRHDTDQHKRRQEAQAEWQYCFDAGALSGDARGRSQPASSVVGEVHEYLSKRGTGMVRSNDRARDRCPALVATRLDRGRPRNLGRCAKRRQRRDAAQHAPDLAVKAPTNSRHRLRRHSAGRQASCQQIECRRNLPCDRRLTRRSPPTWRPITRAGRGPFNVLMRACVQTNNARADADRCGHHVRGRR